VVRGASEVAIPAKGFAGLLPNVILLYPKSLLLVELWNNSLRLPSFVCLSTARQALAGIHDPRFKVHKYTEAAAGLGGQLISFSVTGWFASQNSNS